MLSALKSHDERIQGFVSAGSNGGSTGLPDNVEIDLPLGTKFRVAICDGIAAKAIRRMAAKIPLTEELIWEWMLEHKEKNGRWPAKACVSPISMRNQSVVRPAQH